MDVQKIAKAIGHISELRALYATQTIKNKNAKPLLDKLEIVEAGLVEAFAFAEMYKNAVYEREDTIRKAVEKLQYQLDLNKDYLNQIADLKKQIEELEKV